eukprot:TRINITY_DN458_c0_g2_i1.p1 TRINITY_DN458_c0_g2~~TRINITY_DN458_c0_g2_i1.p1  ORF type:complete len:262 (+),score=47.75 TRINITY_DN458_c0_g2_i1:30-788(+)
MTAVKFTILEKVQLVDSLLQKEIGSFLSLLKDKELAVRRSALFTINYAAHHKPNILRKYLKEYLPVLYGETRIKPELIREVDLGPFKHKVDDGLELRKAAFECMYTLLDTCIDQIDFSDYTQQMVSGLTDHYDVKMLNNLILARLASRAGAPLLSGLDKLIEPLRKILNEKLKEGTVKQQVERNEELKRSALRAIASVNRIPNVSGNQKWADFMKNTVKQADLADKYATIAKEVAESLERFDSDMSQSDIHN